MREAAFVKQNKEKWMAFENALQNKGTISPDLLANYYIQLTNDLAYAQTYYPQSKTLTYLNHLASEAHQEIYVNKREDRGKIIRFFKHDFPLFFYRYQKELLISFLVFFVSVLIGAISSYYDDNFVRLILGDGYVNMTQQNIEDGNPLGVYQENGPFGMFLYITINNIRVAMLAFAMGVFTSIGTGYILFNNGVMLGAFMTFFFKQGLSFEFNKVVWLHGATEISMIIIAGCAGIIMGNSILFPKTYSRKESFIRGAKDGLKVMISTIPFFILAGFIEGFITRYSNMPNILAFTIIFATLGFVIWYYIIYPIQLNRKYATGENQSSESA